VRAFGIFLQRDKALPRVPSEDVAKAVYRARKVSESNRKRERQDRQSEKMQ
jgi:hypothetical protein